MQNNCQSFEKSENVLSSEILENILFFKAQKCSKFLEVEKYSKFWSKSLDESSDCLWQNPKFQLPELAHQRWGGDGVGGKGSVF